MLAPEVTIVPNYLDRTAATELYELLRDRIEWDDRISARKTACFGVPYNYSGLNYPPTAMHPALEPLCDRLQQTLGFLPNNCLVNYYLDGRSKMGFHADDIDHLATDSQIIIISLGAERKLSFRSNFDYSQRAAYLLPHGSLLYMSLETQTYWSHAIKRSTDREGRISLTFRQIISVHS
jgi:alkylated DNA repair dioxygenase AlkB